MAELFDEILNDVEKKESENMQDKLAQLGEYIKYLHEAEKIVAEKEKELKEAKEKVKHFSASVIPDYFDSIGLSAVKMDSGETVSIKTDYACSITKANESAAFNYLRENGLGEIIKHAIEVQKRGSSGDFDKIKEVLNTLAMTYKESEKVHPQTLKAVVKEKIESGEQFPDKLFSVYPMRKTVIK